MGRTAALLLAAAAAGCGSTVGAAIVADAGTGTTGASPSTEAVDTSDDSAGSTASADTTPAGETSEPPPDFSLRLEAEEAELTPPMEIAADPEASNGEYVLVPGMGGRYPDAEARFAVDVPTGGHYKLWPRIYADHLGSNSFTLELDGVEIKENWTWAVRSQWTIEGDVELELSAGPHDLTVRGREAGTRLDYLVLASAFGEPPPEP